MAHALLSASGAEKWFNCPPSARREEGLPDTTSSYAAEGTLAHELADLINRYNLQHMNKRAFTKAFDALKQHELYNPEMEEHCGDFGNYVHGKYQAAKKKTPDAVCLTEQRLDFSAYVPEGFGTGDVIIIADGVLEIIDYKYGKGVTVSAEGNKQMMLYALGALQAYDFQYAIDAVSMTIYQSRLSNISKHSMTVAELKLWAENELRPVAILAHKGEGVATPGGHCRFCKVFATCREHAAHHLAQTRHDFALPPLLSDEEIPDILAQLKPLKLWADKLEAYALAEALKGKLWPGYKLVEVTGRRKYADEAAVAEKLRAEGYAEDEIYTRALLGIGALEKAIGKKEFSAILEPSGLILRPPGAPKLVEDSDEHPALHITNAAEDFDDGFATEADE